MIDGDHIAKTTVQDACGAFEVFESIAFAAPMAPARLAVEPGGVVVFPAGVAATFGVSASPPGSWRSLPATARGASSPTSQARCRSASPPWRSMIAVASGVLLPADLVLDVSWVAAMNRATDIDPGLAAYAFDVGNSDTQIGVAQ